MGEAPSAGKAALVGGAPPGDSRAIAPKFTLYVARAMAAYVDLSGTQDIAKRARLRRTGGSHSSEGDPRLTLREDAVTIPRPQVASAFVHFGGEVAASTTRAALAGVNGRAPAECGTSIRCSQRRSPA